MFFWNTVYIHINVGLWHSDVGYFIMGSKHTQIGGKMTALYTASLVWCEEVADQIN